MAGKSSNSGTTLRVKAKIRRKGVHSKKKSSNNKSSKFYNKKNRGQG
jgi:hypothetical protein